MRQWLLLLLLPAAMAFGSASVYSVQPVNMSNSAFVVTATQQVTATADSIAAADVFIGQKRGGGDWVVTVADDQGHYTTAAVGAATTGAYSFVHFAFPTRLAVRKGSKLTLAVSHSSPDSLTEVFWDVKKYGYGTLSWTGGSKPSPQPGDSCALAAKITGVNRVITSKPDVVSGR